MSRFKTLLILASDVAVLGVVGAIVTSREASAQNPVPGSAPVNIVSPIPLPVTGNVGITGTVSVQDARADVRTPFQRAGRGSDAFMVDPDKQLTIEFVTMSCKLPINSPGVVATIVTTAGGQLATHYLFPRLQYPFPLSSDNVYGAAEVTRIYSDPGGGVSMHVWDDSQSCFWSVSGYTAPK